MKRGRLADKSKGEGEVIRAGEKKRPPKRHPVGNPDSLSKLYQEGKELAGQKEKAVRTRP